MTSRDRDKHAKLKKNTKWIREEGKTKRDIERKKVMGGDSECKTKNQNTKKNQTKERGMNRNIYVNATKQWLSIDQKPL